MTRSSSSTRPESSASPSEQATAKRPRNAYRRQLAAARPGVPTIGPEARRAAVVILEVLAGVRTPGGAAGVLGIRLPRYYLLEQRAIAGLIAACEPRPRGRTVSADRQLARLERELAVSQRELARHQALARTTQRALGLAPPVSPPVTAAGKTRAAPNGTTQRRRRKPATRALRAARLLRSVDSPGGEAPATVQEAVGSHAAAGSAAGVIRPVAREETHS
jgi:hypothetical protein